MKRFYVLKFAQLRDEIMIDLMIDYNDEELKNGIFKTTEVVNGKISEGTRKYDILRYQDPFNFSISEKFYLALIENNISGWSSYELQIKGIKENYYGFQVLGRCGEIVRPKSEGFVKGYNFELNTWDKKDFFRPIGTQLVFCTEKVKHIIEEFNFTNIKLEDISMVSWYSV